MSEESEYVKHLKEIGSDVVKVYLDPKANAEYRSHKIVITIGGIKIPFRSYQLDTNATQLGGMQLVIRLNAPTFEIVTEPFE